MKIGILESKHFSSKALDQLRLVGEVSTMHEENVQTYIEDKNVLFVRLKYFLGPELLDAARGLKYICSPTTGLNHIDTEYARERGIAVISLKGEQEFLSTIRATPEHAFGLTLALLRNYKNAINSRRDREQFIGEELYRNKIGLIGMGRVGTILAGYFSQFGAEVLFYDPFVPEDAMQTATKAIDLIGLIKQTNIVLLCASYNKENERFIDKTAIDALQGKYFINIARGELVDEEYLLQAINNNYFKGVALDVLCNETQKNNFSRFLQLTDAHHLILTPHIGGATSSSMQRTEEFIVSKLAGQLEKN